MFGVCEAHFGWLSVVVGSRMGWGIGRSKLFVREVGREVSSMTR